MFSRFSFSWMENRKITLVNARKCLCENIDMIMFFALEARLQSSSPPPTVLHLRARLYYTLHNNVNAKAHYCLLFILNCILETAWNFMSFSVTFFYVKWATLKNLWAYRVAMKKVFNKTQNELSTKNHSAGSQP